MSDIEKEHYKWQQKYTYACKREKEAEAAWKKAQREVEIISYEWGAFERTVQIYDVLAPARAALDAAEAAGVDADQIKEARISLEMAGRVQ